jgi:dienelactone hydrolase
MKVLRNLAVRGVLALAAGLLATSSPMGQSSGGVSPGGPPLRPSRIVPARPAQWQFIEERGSTTDYELGTSGDWFYWPPFLQWRFLEASQWATTDPIVEVDIYPPYSGSATNIEAFFLQVPLTNPVAAEDRTLIMGFHGSQVSPAQIFGVGAGVTDLPQLCTDNGWLLMAPNGLHTSNMASEPTQKALEVDLAFVFSVLPFNPDRVYSLGFSMGGLNATSFALRHQDPFALRTAGIIYHTGTTDIVRDYNEASAHAKLTIWEDPLVFDASPTENPFAYDRVNPARFDAAGTGFQDEYFQLDAIKHTPFYLHYNTNDPTKYDGWTNVLKDALNEKGFTVESVVSTTLQPKHSIFTLDFADALDYVTETPLGPLPSAARIFADRPTRYLWSRMISNPAPSIARYTVSIDAALNSFAVSDTHHVDELGFAPSLMGLSPALTLTFTAASGDLTPDTYVLSDYPAAPTSILVDGLPPLATSYDPIKGEVSISPNATGNAALVEIIP